MNFWDHLYDKYKDRRYGVLFLSALLAFGGVLMLGFFLVTLLQELIADVDLDPYLRNVLPGLGLLGLAWVFSKLRQARNRSRARAGHAPLSRDELRVARSKLRSGMKPFRPPGLRTPDTNLKY